MNYKEEIFKECAKFAESFHNNYKPRLVSVGIIPMGADNRVLYSHPVAFKLVVKFLSEKIKDLNFDIICGIETAGIPLAAALGYELDIPFCYIRKEPKKTGKMDYIEGDYKPGMTALLVDDLMANGKTKKLMVENLKKCKIKVNDLLVIWAAMAEFFQNDPARIWLKKEGIKIHYLYTWLELVEGIHKNDAIPDKLYEYYIDYLNHPESWIENKKKLKEYIKIVRKLDIEVPRSIIELL